MERYMSTRSRTETPEMVTIAIRKTRFLSWVMSALALVGTGGGVLWFSDKTDQVSSEASESREQAVVADRKVNAVDRQVDTAYTHGAVKDREHDDRLGTLAERFNDLREFCIATRSSGRGRDRKVPAAVATTDPKPIPPTLEAAVRQESSTSTPPTAPTPAADPAKE